MIFFIIHRLIEWIRIFLFEFSVIICDDLWNHRWMKWRIGMCSKWNEMKNRFYSNKLFFSTDRRQVEEFSGNRNKESEPSGCSTWMSKQNRIERKFDENERSTCDYFVRNSLFHSFRDENISHVFDWVHRYSFCSSDHVRLSKSKKTASMFNMKKKKKSKWPV